jgi:hypothetical protein
MRHPLRNAIRFGVILPALALSALAMSTVAAAQDYDDLPPLSPLSEEEVRDLPGEYRTAPVITQTAETTIGPDGVETITRTRRIDYRSAPPSAAPQGYAPQGYAPQGYAPVVFEREQWLDECRRRTTGRSNDDTGVIIGSLLGAIAGGVAGYEIAGVGDRVLGTALGVGGGGLIGGLLGSLFGGGKKKDRYDCEAALDGYLTQYGTPYGRIASREIEYAPYAGGPAYANSYSYGYPAAYSYGYAYAPPPQVVLIQVRTEQQQQVVVRETERYETYTVPGAVREIPLPAPRPSPKMIKNRR